MRERERELRACDHKKCTHSLQLIHYIGVFLLCMYSSVVCVCDNMSVCVYCVRRYAIKQKHVTFMCCS